MELYSAQSDHFLCHYTFVIDTYRKYCDIGCVYCYADDFPKPEKFIENIEDIENIFSAVFDKNENHAWSNVLKSKTPVRVGFETDPFQRAEKSNKVTLRLLKLFNQYNYPFIIFTKSPLILDDIYKEVLRNDLAYVQVSMSSFDEQQSLAVEKRADIPYGRINILNELKYRGVDCALRLNLLPKSLRVKKFENRNIYFEHLISNIKKLDVSKVIVNDIQDRSASQNFSPTKVQWKSFVSELEQEKKSVSYCYLGGKMSYFYEYNDSSCSDCCQCDVGHGKTDKDVSIVDEWRIAPEHERIGVLFNKTLLNFMRFFLRSIFRK